MCIRDSTYTVQYQAIAYRFDPATSTMRFRYGPLMNEEDVVDPYSPVSYTHLTLPTSDLV